MSLEFFGSYLCLTPLFAALILGYFWQRQFNRRIAPYMRRKISGWLGVDIKQKYQTHWWYVDTKNSKLEYAILFAEVFVVWGIGGTGWVICFLIAGFLVFAPLLELYFKIYGFPLL